jgi:hypothetical protein
MILQLSKTALFLPFSYVHWQEEQAATIIIIKNMGRPVYHHARFAGRLGDLVAHPRGNLGRVVIGRKRVRRERVAVPTSATDTRLSNFEKRVRLQRD